MERDSNARKVCAEVRFVLGSYFTRGHDHGMHVMPTLLSSAQMQYSRYAIQNGYSFVGMLIMWFAEKFPFISRQTVAVIVSSVMYYIESVILKCALPSSANMVYLPMKQMMGAVVGASICDYAGSLMIGNAAGLVLGEVISSPSRGPLPILQPVRDRPINPIPMI